MLLNSLLSITLAIGPAPAPSTSDIPVAELRGQLAALVADRDITAGLIHVRDGPNRWSGAVGVRDLTSEMPAVATGHFRIGSVTKTFAAPQSAVDRAVAGLSPWLRTGSTPFDSTAKIGDMSKGGQA